MLDGKTIGRNGVCHAVKRDGNIPDAGAQFVTRCGDVIYAGACQKAVFLLRNIRRDHGERHGHILPTGLILLQSIAQDEKIAHVVAVQVGKQDRVDLKRWHKLEKAGKRAAPKVEQQPALPAFEQVARTGAAGCGEWAVFSKDCQLHDAVTLRLLLRIICAGTRLNIHHKNDTISLPEKHGESGEILVDRVLSHVLQCFGKPLRVGFVSVGFPTPKRGRDW